MSIFIDSFFPSFPQYFHIYKAYYSLGTLQYDIVGSFERDREIRTG